ncbi:MAG: hypothetical protein COA96_18295 [SAR86 cluster bacterium]|uniref:Uncharacterized protein n=1 Tax=SAR86 cluster bacterium TaxID=2030880 RepID=A0A2A5AC78_9GAMM|nr:MAG: hypothetical protein COA96_18295 [SAR86 cluster bacterium]
MSDIDEKIRKALATEDQKAIDDIGSDAGLIELMALTFKGKQAWMTYYMYVLGFAVMAAAVYFLIQYLGTSDIKSSLNWALLLIVCFLTLSVVKILAWQQIQKMDLMREIKRLEMRIMLIVERDNKNQ